jgi:hypothetical protein
MIFAWDETNIEHLAKHNVNPAQAEEVVRSARPPYPRAIGAGKHMIWGKTYAGRYLQVIIVFKSPDQVEFESLTPEQWSDVQAGEVTRIIRVIHAMPMTEDMKRRYAEHLR